MSDSRNQSFGLHIIRSGDAGMRKISKLSKTALQKRRRAGVPDDFEISDIVEMNDEAIRILSNTAATHEETQSEYIEEAFTDISRIGRGKISLAPARPEVALPLENLSSIDIPPLTDPDRQAEPENQPLSVSGSRRKHLKKLKPSRNKRL